MNELVFLEPNKIDAVPFTTSKIISERAGVAHRHIKTQIENHNSELKSFGLLVAYATESTGGRPEEITALNEQQATLLITFLKNTPVVVAFKTELVRQFFLMRTELLKRRVYREELKPVRRELTDVIQSIPDHGKWAYKQYTDLAYKCTIGKNAAQLRKERNAGKNSAAVDYMNADEIKRVIKSEYQIAVLLDMSLSYGEVKTLVNSKKTIGASVNV